MTNCLAQICSRIKNAQNFFKFSLIDISNMLILILKSKIIFMKLLPPKLARKLKMLLIYLNLAYVIFQICQFWFKCQKKKTMKHLPPVRTQNWQCSEYIEIWYICCFKYTNIYFKVKNNFYQISINRDHFSFWDQFELNRL